MSSSALTPAAAKGLTVNSTAAFCVIDPPGFKQPEVAAPPAPAAAAAVADGKAADAKRTEGARAKKGTGASIEGAKIGGDFAVTKNPEWLAHRLGVWAKCAEKYAAEIAAKPKDAITITMPDGSTKEGVAFETSPMDIAKGISDGLARSCVIAKVKYAGAVDDGPKIASIEEDEEDDAADAEQDAQLWDMTRPLCGDCTLHLLKFSDKEGKEVFWHSSAHLLGMALEHNFGGKLTHGPALDSGFFYDCYMGGAAVGDKDWKALEKDVQGCVKKKAPFERVVLSREDALEMFQHNPFKVAIIESKIPVGGLTTCYKQGDFIDLCMGPHIPNAGVIKAFQVTRNSSAYWLGEADNDSLQRVYGISFPDKKELKAWQVRMEEAAKRDHRKIGTDQELFFFHALSPGSAFMQPHGARLYNTLVEFIKTEYWRRGYTEVMSPNVFNFDLWHTSGHALHYKENMFCFDVEGAEFGLKPMNCPGHCLMFQHRLRSYRELPLRYADFGVLHRNELSGALTGLTRVRRFQQDDAHIFCRRDQIASEVVAALEFMKRTYDVFGMTFVLELSTRPKKALGDMALWDVAEEALAEAMDNFAGKGGWKVNAGDGAFYGPKIDIQVFDALGRDHQCATIQLDFQLPIRFNLKYRVSDPVVAKGPKLKKAEMEAAAKAAKAAEKFERPVIVHRAMLGSVERMMAILIEHYAGKWPFWLSPRQIMVVPIDLAFSEYASKVRERMHAGGFHCDVDLGSNTLNKKIREHQMAQYNYVLVVGEKEQENDTVNIRTRTDGKLGEKSVAETLAMFKGFVDDPKHTDM